MLPTWALALYGCLSVATFFAYARDKAAAQAGRWRTSEAALLFLGLLDGWPGAFLAQRAYRHKTSKVSFQLAFWASVAANTGMLLRVAIASPTLPT